MMESHCSAVSAASQTSQVFCMDFSLVALSAWSGGLLMRKTGKRRFCAYAKRRSDAPVDAEEEPRLAAGAVVRPLDRDRDLGAGGPAAERRDPRAHAGGGEREVLRWQSVEWAGDR